MIKKLLSRFRKNKTDDDEALYEGKVRPPQVPENWIGESLPENQGWAWTNPENRGDCVRLYRDQGEGGFVIITRDGMLIGSDGKPTGERFDD